MKLDSVSHVLLELPSKYAIYKRIALLALSIFVVLACVYVWLSSHLAMNQYYHSQTNQLGTGLANQYQIILSEHLSDKNMDRMQLIVDAITNDKHVLSASIFDQFGRELISLPHTTQYVRLYSESSTFTPMTFVSEIRDNNELLGYLRLVMDGQQASSQVIQLEKAFLSRTFVIMLLALLTGIILTRTFYKWRMKSVKIKRNRRL